jgi:hypothetical protein
MKKSLAVLALTLFSVTSQAKIRDLKCVGQDREGQKLTILWDEWKDNRDGARVDLTIDTEGIGPRTTVDLNVYIDNEGGFDYGVTSPSGSFMFHLVYPYNVENPKEVRGDYYYGNKFDLDSRVFLTCRPTRIKKD